MKGRDPIPFDVAIHGNQLISSYQDDQGYIKIRRMKGETPHQIQPYEYPVK